ncbi:MAG: hypothetical protein ACOYM2_00625 [Rectinemataceae bacterium]
MTNRAKDWLKQTEEEMRWVEDGQKIHRSPNAGPWSVSFHSRSLKRASRASPSLVVQARSKATRSGSWRQPGENLTQTEGRFVERALGFQDLCDLVPDMDLFVHTPEEFRKLRSEPSPGFWKSAVETMRRIV